VNWESPVRIVVTYGLTRSTVYRHARAFDLFAKRQANIRAALEAIIERAAEVEVNASAVVAAVAAYSKISPGGRWIERTETVNLNQFFDRMSIGELETYAKTGELPGWFPVVPVAPGQDGRDG
jgi:hypothetical protein